MTFSEALELVKGGQKVKRASWGAWERTEWVHLLADPRPFRSYLRRMDAEGYHTPWLPTQDDLLADDWQPVP